MCALDGKDGDGNDLLTSQLARGKASRQLSHQFLAGGSSSVLYQRHNDSLRPAAIARTSTVGGGGTSCAALPRIGPLSGAGSAAASVRSVRTSRFRAVRTMSSIVPAGAALRYRSSVRTLDANAGAASS